MLARLLHLSCRFFFHWVSSICFTHCCFFNYRINQVKEITWSYQKREKKCRRIFQLGHLPYTIQTLCFPSKSNLLKYNLDKGIWFRKGVWYLVKHLTPCQIITEKLSEIHSWIISINCVTTSCPSTGTMFSMLLVSMREASVWGNYKKYGYHKNLLADWWAGEDSSPYIKKDFRWERPRKFFSTHR